MPIGVKMLRAKNIYLVALSVIIPSIGLAEDTVDPLATPEPTPWYENNESVPYNDNTGALSAVKTDNTADVVTESEEEVAAGALEGEITVWKREDKYMVYSNGNRVEDLIKGIGAIGSITSYSSGMVKFQPTGKEELNCPAQDIAEWYGPCKLTTADL
jgi:hypothetical protein